jgi:hypothetical protein
MMFSPVAEICGIKLALGVNVRHRTTGCRSIGRWQFSALMLELIRSDGGFGSQKFRGMRLD